MQDIFLAYINIGFHQVFNSPITIHYLLFTTKHYFLPNNHSILKLIFSKRIIIAAEGHEHNE